MGRPRHALYFKPQAKTADIRRAVPGALAVYQAHGPGQHLAHNHAQKLDAWDVTLAQQENDNEGSFLTCNLPPPSEALMDSAAEFINGVLSDLRAMDIPMLPVTIDEYLMDCDPTANELMDVDEDLDLDHMNVDTVGPHADHSPSLAAVPMDVAEDPWSMAVVPFRPPTSMPPTFPAFNDCPMTPPQVCPDTPPWKEVSVELSLARRELALVAKALQRLPVCALHSPVQEPPAGSPVQKAPVVAQPGEESLLVPAAISSGHPSPEQRELSVDPGVEVVVEGIRTLDISDDSEPICSTPFTPLDEPIPLTVALPEIQPKILSFCSESSNSTQELGTFNTADLLGLDSVEPLHSTPIHDDNGKSPDALGVWADIADLKMLCFYIDLPIPDLPDDGFITFPSSRVSEVVSVFDLPAADHQPRQTDAVNILPCSAPRVDEIIDRVISIEISDKAALADAPCESVVLVPDNGPHEDGPFVNRISSEDIARLLKNRAERDAWKKARKAQTKERRRREANPRSASEPGSPAPDSLSQIKTNVSMPNSPISTSLLPKKLARTVTKNGAYFKQGISNMDTNVRLPLRIASHFRISSRQKQNQGTPLKGTPFMEIGKENAPPVEPKTSPSPSTKQSVVKEKIQDSKQSALSSPRPLSIIDQNIQRLPTIPASSSHSSINSKSVPAKERKTTSSDTMLLSTPRTSTSLNSLFDEMSREESEEASSSRAASLLSRTTPIEPTIPTPQARLIHLPYAHSQTRQRDKRITPPKTPGSYPARTKGNYAFFAPRERCFRRSTAYTRLDDPSGDAIHSYIETSPLDATDNAPEWIVTEATKKKVLPGAVPTTEYHEDIGPSSPTTSCQPAWFGRLKGFLFGW